LQTLLLISDSRDDVCERILLTDLHSDVLEKLSWKTLSAESLNDPQSSAKRFFVLYCVIVLYNIVRRAAFREMFKTCQSVRNLYEFCDVTKYPVNIFSFVLYKSSFTKKTYCPCTFEFCTVQCYGGT